MIERFEGQEGLRRLISVLQNSRIVEHNEALAKRLAEDGEVLSIKAGDDVITQGASDNDIYIILVGEADVIINNRPVAIRKQGDTIGEMTILNPTELRAATVQARSDLLVLKLIEPDFQQIAVDYPQVWKVIAVVSSERLRQRTAFLALPNSNPVLFLGCSAESLDVAREIQLGLNHDPVQVSTWADGVFGPSKITIDALMDVVQQADFAVFVFSPDDKVFSRDKEYNAPRDNVIFELGLFMGKLERKRTFIVKERGSDLKIPTDLLGITLLDYVHQGGDFGSAIAPVCTQLRKIIGQLGTR